MRLKLSGVLAHDLGLIDERPGGYFSIGQFGRFLRKGMIQCKNAHHRHSPSAEVTFWQQTAGSL